MARPGMLGLRLALAWNSQFRGAEVVIGPDGALLQVGAARAGSGSGSGAGSGTTTTTTTASSTTKYTFPMDPPTRDVPESCYAWALRYRYEHLGCFQKSDAAADFTATVSGSTFDPARCAYVCSNDVTGEGGTQSKIFQSPDDTPPFVVGVSGKDCYCIATVSDSGFANMDTIKIDNMPAKVRGLGWTSVGETSCSSCVQPCYWESDEAGYSENDPWLDSSGNQHCSVYNKLEVTDIDRCLQGAQAFSPDDSDSDTPRSAPGVVDEYSDSSHGPHCYAVVKAEGSGNTGEAEYGHDLDGTYAQSSVASGSTLQKICTRGIGFPCTQADNRTGSAGFQPKCGDCFEDLVDKYGGDELGKEDEALYAVCSRCDYCEDEIHKTDSTPGLGKGDDTKGNCKCGTKPDDNSTASVSIYRVGGRVAKPTQSNAAEYEYFYRGCYETPASNIDSTKVQTYDQTGGFDPVSCAAKCSSGGRFPDDGQFFSIRGGAHGCYCYNSVGYKDIDEKKYFQGELLPTDSPYADGMNMGTKINDTECVDFDVACFHQITPFPCESSPTSASVPHCKTCHACENAEFCSSNCDYCLNGVDGDANKGSQMTCKRGGGANHYALYQVRRVGWSSSDDTVQANIDERDATTTTTTTAGAGTTTTTTTAT